MKKALTMILAAVLLLASVAAAEAFVLRNGIMFGDTIEEVLNNETFAINSSNEDSDQSSSGKDYPYYINTEHETLAGIKDSYIHYSFDAEKALREVIYYFRSSSNQNIIDADYEKVNDGLIRKYGSPLGYSNGDCYIITGSALSDVAAFVDLSISLGGFGAIVDYDEWDVEADGHHVKIEQIAYYLGTSASDIKYGHKVGYTYFTDEDLAEKIDEKNADLAAVDNDL